MEQKASAGLGPMLTLWTYYQKNRNTVHIGGVVLVVVVLGIMTYVMQQNQKLVSAGEAITEVLVGGTARGQTVTMAQLLKVAADHPGTDAAGRAVFQAATLAFTEGNYAESQKLFQRFLSENPDNTFVPQARYGLATCLESLGKDEEAAKAYRDLSDRFKMNGIGISALLGLGRVLESQGKLAEALLPFEEVLKMDPQGTLGNEARVRAALIQRKLPRPVVPATISQLSTNAP
jgi:TolA-binding protein